METVRHASQPEDRSRFDLIQFSAYLPDIRNSRVFRMPQIPEFQERSGVTVPAIMRTAAAVGVQPGQVEAFRALVPADCLVNLPAACAAYAAKRQGLRAGH